MWCMFHDHNVVMQTSLRIQWIKICLLMQGTRVRPLVWEDSTCCATTKACVCHNY